MLIHKKHRNNNKGDLMIEEITRGKNVGKRVMGRCDYCGKKFNKWYSDVKFSVRQYCDKKCRGLSKRNIPRLKVIKDKISDSHKGSRLIKIYKYSGHDNRDTKMLGRILNDLMILYKFQFTYKPFRYSIGKTLNK